MAAYMLALAVILNNDLDSNNIFYLELSGSYVLRY